MHTCFKRKKKNDEIIKILNSVPYLKGYPDEQKRWDPGQNLCDDKSMKGQTWNSRRQSKTAFFVHKSQPIQYFEVTLFIATKYSNSNSHLSFLVYWKVLALPSYHCNVPYNVDLEAMLWLCESVVLKEKLNKMYKLGEGEREIIGKQEC